MESDEIQREETTVQFVGVSDKYTTRRDVEIVVQFGPQFVPTTEDWVGLFPLGWRSLNQRTTQQWIRPGRNDKCIVTIPKYQLPTNISQYYQFVYVNGNDEILAISNPVYFVDVREGDFELSVLKEEDEEAKKDSNLSVVKSASTSPQNSCLIETNSITHQTSIVLASQTSEKPILIVPQISSANRPALFSRETTNLMSTSSALRTTMSLADSCSPLYSFSAFPSSFLSISPQSHHSLSPCLSSTPTDPDDDNKSAGDNNADSNDAMALVPWIERSSVIWTPTPVVVLSVRPVEDSSEDDSRSTDETTVSDIGPLAPTKSRSARKARVRLDARPIPLDFYERTDFNSDWVPVSDAKTESVWQPTVRSDVSSDASTASSVESDLPKTSLEKKGTKDAHLDKVVVRFFHFLGSVIARQSKRSTTTASRSNDNRSRLEVGLDSVESRDSHAENREVEELAKKVKQQESKTAELLDRIKQQNDDGKLFKSQCLSEMQQATRSINRLALEKKNLETKVGNLTWEKAALYAKLQVLQQGEARYTRKATELSNVLMEAQEEIHHLSRRNAESQQFIDGLLATLAALGFVRVRDPSGVGINLDNVTGPGLALEPAVDASGLPKWSRKPRFSDKWYKAMMASQEIIRQLQTQVRQLEEQERQRGRYRDIQKSLTEEKKRSKNLQEQINTMMLMMSNRADSTPSSELKREFSGSSIKSREILNYTIHESMSSELDVPGIVYESQGARPKLLKFVHKSPMCEPADELESPSSLRFSAYSPSCPSTSSVDGYGYAPNCPYCGEMFPTYLLPADRQEHIRMHMYSELQRKNYILNGT